MADVRRNSRRMQKLRAEFFAEGKRLDADPATRPASVCWLCGQRVDYDADPGSSDDSHELDHYYPVSLRPELQEDPAGFRHAHRKCNGQRGNRAPRPGLGRIVPAWW